MRPLGRRGSKRPGLTESQVFASPRLDPVSARDANWLPDALGRWGCSLRWSDVWGQTPSPDGLSRLLWQDVFVQRAVRADGDRTVGLIQASKFRIEDGVADLDLLVDPAYLVAADGVLEEFLSQVFADHPLRKLCLAICSDDLALTPHLARVAQQVGCLVEHRRRGRDHFVDINLYEIWADGLDS